MPDPTPSIPQKSSPDIPTLPYATPRAAIDPPLPPGMPTLEYGRTRPGNELNESRLDDTIFHGFCAGVVISGIPLLPFAYLGYIYQKTQAQLVCAGVIQCLLMLLFQIVLRSTKPRRFPKGHLWFSVAGGFLNSMVILATLYIASTWVPWCNPQSHFTTAVLAAIGEIFCYTLAATILLQLATRE